MLGIILVAVLGAAVLLWRPRITAPGSSSRFAVQLDKLWDISRNAIKDKKYLHAEKALLTILRVDERDARAYNRLGVLYAKQKNLSDAIECFEIAQSLEPSASSLHNVGLIYYESGNLAKAELAFEQALKLENDVASRHIAYAKVLEATGQTAKMLTELEEAVRLEPNPESINIFADALEHNDQPERAAKYHKIARDILAHGKRTHIKQPRRARI